MSFRASFALAALCAALMAGCASVPPLGVPLPDAAPDLAAKWQHRQMTLSAVTRFTLTARVATNGGFGVTGTLHWQEDNGRFLIHFSGPLGAGAVDIAGDPYVVTIRSGKERYVTSEPERFLLQHFGWTLPLRGLRYWALGLPAPTAVDTAPATLLLNGKGYLRSLAQDGWQIDYTDYQRAPPYALPHKMTMQGEKTTFRIIIDEWQVPPASP